MNAISLLRAKNRMLGVVAPEKVAKDMARLFLSPRRFAQKDWEAEAELAGRRCTFGPGLSALCWGQGNPERILIMHGWESRATQMYGIASVLADSGFEVIAIDAPMHGESRGNKANPVEFAEAIVQADIAFGPFYGAIGHSMGGAALAIARDKGVQLGRYVLISSPAVLYETLRGFAGFMGLSDKCTRRFIHYVETEVGRPSKELDVAAMLQGNEFPPLLIHARDDVEVPYAAATKIHHSLKGSMLWTAEKLGHRKIVRDHGVAGVVLQYLTDGEVVRQPGALKVVNATA